MEKILIFLEENPQLLTLAEILGKILLCVLGIILYRRTGKVLSVQTQPQPQTQTQLTKIDPVDGLSLAELEQFAVVLTQTVQGIEKLRSKHNNG